MPTVIQQAPKATNGGAAAFNLATTFLAPPVIGRSVVVVVWGFTTSTVETLGDQFGNIYTLKTSINDANIPSSIAVYLCEAITATGPSFTLSIFSNPPAARMITAFEMTPVIVDTFGPAAANAGASATLGPTAAVVGPDILALALLGSSSTFYTLGAASPPWVEALAEGGPSPRGTLATRAISNAAGLGVSVSWTLNGANFWVGLIVVFRDGAPLPPVSTGPRGRPIGMLPGKVTATNALDISTTAALDAATRTAHLDGDTAYTDAVLIPAPGPTEQIVILALSASALVAGPFSVAYRTAGTPVLGPLWLPSTGAAALTTGRVFESGPIARALPAGQGLTVTTSGDAPQSFDAEYQIVSVA